MFITGSVQSLRGSRDCLRPFHLGLCLADTSVCFIIGSFSRKRRRRRRGRRALAFLSTSSSGLLSARHSPGLLIPLSDMNSCPCFFWSRCCCLQILQRLSPCRGLQWWVCGAIGLSAQNPGGLWFVWCGSGHKPLGSRLIGIHSSPHLILLLAARRKGKKMRYEL